MEGRLSKGESVDLNLYQRSANTLRRLIASLGLRKVAPKEVGWRDRMKPAF